jgi:hypothetical protein
MYNFARVFFYKSCRSLEGFVTKSNSHPWLRVAIFSTILKKLIMNVIYVPINTQLISFSKLFWSSVSALPRTGLKDHYF